MNRISVAGLILAAGLSTRFGGNKLIEPIGGEPLIRKTVTSWLKSEIAELYVVTGHHRQAIARALAGLDLELLENQRFETGLASSVATGIKAVQDKYDFVLIGLGDMPYIKSKTIDTLIEAAGHDQAGPDKKLWIPLFENQRGNPVLWQRATFPDLLSLQGDQGGRPLFPKYMSAIQEVPVSDPGILRDIDVSTDLD